MQSPSQQQQTAIERWWAQFRAGRERCEQAHVVVYLPECAPAPGTHAHQNSFFENLAAVTDEVIDSYEVRILGKEICLCKECRRRDHHQDLLATVTDLMFWEREGLQASGFVQRKVSPPATGECHSVISLPELAVGVYLDDSLFGVFPCRSDEAYYSPQRYLRGLTGNAVASGSTQDHSAIQSDSA